MKTGKYWVQQPQTSITSNDSQSKAYFVVIGLALGSLLAVAGGVMGYIAYFDELQDLSVAAAFHIPTKIIGLVLLGLGSVLVLCSFLVCSCFGFPSRVTL